MHSRSFRTKQIRPIVHRFAFPLSLALTVLAPLSASAASDVWDGGAGDGSWLTFGNWASDAQFPGLAINDFTSLDDASFGSVGSATPIDLGGFINIRSLIYGISGSDAAAVTIGDANDLLNLTTGGGVTINAGVTTAQFLGVGGTTINLSNVANSTAVFQNDGAGLLTIGGNLVGNMASGNGLITFAGTGNTTVTGTITKPGAGAMALLKSGTGTLTLTNGGVFNGTGVVGGAGNGNNASLPFVVRSGSLRFNGGAYTVTGEAAVGDNAGVGATGNNANLTIDAGSLNVTTWLSVGRGNGTGTVSSDVVLNGNSTISAVNFALGYNNNNVANRPKATVTLNDASVFTVTNNNANFNFAESAGSYGILTLNGISRLVHNGGATGTKIGISGTGVLNVNSAGATVDVRNLIIGQGANGVGAVYHQGTLKSVGLDGLFMGDGAGSASYFRNDNGAATVANDNAANIVAGIGNNSNAVVDVMSGRLSATRVGAGFFNNTNATNSQYNVTGGELASGATGFLVGDDGAKVNKWANVNVTGPGIFTNPGVINLSNANNAANTGILSIKGGGTATADTITTGGTASNTFINLDQGTLRASSGTTATWINGNIDRVTAYEGGAVFDTNGFSKSIDAPITAPVADGVTTFGITSVQLSGVGTNYEGRPVVKITGGGGTGATAIADFDLATGTVTGVTMTSPGSGYTSAPTVTILGGGGTALTATASMGSVNGGGIAKTGDGVLTLSAPNTYTGSTHVAGGALVVNGSLAATSDVGVDAGATLTVNGSMNASANIDIAGVLTGAGVVGSVDILAGGVISPGNNTGTFTTGAELWAGGGSYLWQIGALAANGGTQGGTTGWDFINGASSTLGITADGSTKFTLRIDSLGTLAGWDNSVDQSWLIASFGGGISGFSSDNFSLDSTGFADENALGAGFFEVAQVGADLQLQFNAVPEPGVAIALFGGLGAIAAFRRSRQRA
jgi:autotransporter-associated beta strand protein